MNFIIRITDKTACKKVVLSDFTFLYVKAVDDQAGRVYIRLSLLI